MKTQIFIEKALLKHGDKYDYSKVNYTKWNNKIIIICKLHGEFEQIPNNHLNGQGCIKCAISNKKNNIKNFINKSNLIHNYKYDYSESIYINAHTKLIIMCPEHGKFKQTPNAHLNGRNCPMCYKNCKIYNTGEFIKRAEYKHNYRYDYSKVKFLNNNTKITITCKIHGDFEQLPTTHLVGSGCKKCSLSYGRKEELWLNSLNIKIKRHFRIKNYIVDGYDESTNTIYEFNGDYWHGNPNKYNLDDINLSCKKTFRYLYEKTIEKENKLKELGYNFVSIWESDFK